MSDNPIRVKIETDGTRHGTKVTDAETGREIRCQSATLAMTATDIPMLTITVFDFEFNGVKSPWPIDRKTWPVQP